MKKKNLKMRKVLFLIGFFVVGVTAAQNFASGNLLKYIRFFCLFFTSENFKKGTTLEANVFF